MVGERVAVTERRPSFAPFVAVLATVTAGCIAVEASQPAVHLVAPWLVAVAWLVADRVSVHLHLRRNGIELTFGEAVGAAAVVLLSGPSLVAAAAAVAVVTSLGRRQRPLRCVVNALFSLLQTLTCAIVVRALVPAASPRDAVTWAAVIIGSAAGALLVTLFIGWAIRISGEDPEPLDHVVAESLAVSVVTGATGCLAALLAVVAPVAMALLAVPLAALHLLSRAHLGLRERHGRIRQLYALTRDLTRAHDEAATIDVALDHTARALLAEEVELLLIDRDPVVWVRHTDIGTSSVDNASWVDDEVITEVLRTGAPALGAHDAAGAPLLAGGVVVGALVARDRMGDVATFSGDDLPLLESIANHVSVALEKGSLIQQLQGESRQRLHDALHDALTGLPNRRLLNARLDEVLAHPERPAGLVLIDLNGFKEVNDSLGHLTGDRLLVAIARRLSDAMGGHLVARLGGDEFAIVVTDADELEVMVLAERAHAALSQPVDLDDIAVAVGGSVGVALHPDHASDAEELLRLADRAMYVAKSERSGRAVLCDPERDAASSRALALAADLRDAIARGDVALHAQPQIALAGGGVVGVEILARWDHPRFGPVSPVEFVRIAEQVGLISELTHFVIDRAVAASAAWQRSGLDLEVSVNCSMLDLAEPGFADHVRAALGRHGLAPATLTLELTETEVMRDPERVMRVLGSLSDDGVQVSVDDFGTGYSSLAYLRRLPVRELKVDRSFVTDLATADDARAVVRAVVDLAGSLGLRVVAEGVEDRDAADFLRRLGCERAQGWLWSKAVPLSDVPRLVAELDRRQAEHV